MNPSIAIAIACKIVVSDPQPDANVTIRGYDNAQKSSIQVDGMPHFTITFSGDCDGIDFQDTRKTVTPQASDAAYGMKFEKTSDNTK